MLIVLATSSAASLAETELPSILQIAVEGCCHGELDNVRGQTCKMLPLDYLACC